MQRLKDCRDRRLGTSRVEVKRWPMTTGSRERTRVHRQDYSWGCKHEKKWGLKDTELEWWDQEELSLAKTGKLGDFNSPTLQHKGYLRGKKLSKLDNWGGLLGCRNERNKWATVVSQVSHSHHCRPRFSHENVLSFFLAGALTIGGAAHIDFAQTGSRIDYQHNIQLCCS